MDDTHREIVELKEQLALALQRIESLEASIESSKTLQSEDFDAFYLAFENKYRGSQEDIVKRLFFYRDIVRDFITDKDAPLLDLGCGRGEWLDLLSDFGYTQLEGADLNTLMAKLCVEKGYTIKNEDMFSYLKKCEDNRYGAITGFHIIEHISFQKLIVLFKETLRCLKPGGIAIFETPNPRNLFVGACSFHFDPTHLKPIPAELSSFLAEHLGFKVLGIKYANEHPDIPQEILDTPTLPALWHDSLAIGLDYGLAIQKPV